MVFKPQHANIKLDCHFVLVVVDYEIRSGFRQQRFGQIRLTVYYKNLIYVCWGQDAWGIIGCLGYYQGQSLGIPFSRKCGKPGLLVLLIWNSQSHRGLNLVQALVLETLLRREILLVKGRSDGNFMRIHIVITLHVNVYYVRLVCQTHDGMPNLSGNRVCIFVSAGFHQVGLLFVPTVDVVRLATSNFFMPYVGKLV